MPDPVTVYDATSPVDLNRALQSVSEALRAHANDAVPESTRGPGEAQPEAETAESITPDLDIPEFGQLIGVRPEVYDQIRATLKSGKRHLMFYGPPGTGKTSIAELLAAHLHAEYRMVTGSADWSSQDVIGGYQPVGEGKIRFAKGVLLESFDRPLVIDELNRCDIDRVLGPLFTVLSGQPTTLPYRTDPGDEASPRYLILPEQKPGAAAHEFCPTENWRLLATINSIDKASLYQMSYALTRRFGWILVDVPADLHVFVFDYCKAKGIVDGALPNPLNVPLADIWSAVNQVRPMGAAPFIDAIRYCRAVDPAFDFFALASEGASATYLAAFQVFIMPMLDGILTEQARGVAAAVSSAIRFPADAPQRVDLERRLAAMAL
jgi:5-methylcytosine-specific restriction protein B